MPTPSRDPDRPFPEPAPPGPATSDASLRAALDRERTHAQELRQLAESQKRLLRRRSVRIALAIDTRARRARRRLGAHARRARRRSARVQLATLALPARWARTQRRGALEEVVRLLPDPPIETRATTLVVIADSGHAVIPECDVPDLQIIVVLAPGGEPPVGRDDVEVIRASHKTPAAAARDAIARTTGDLVALTRSSSVPLDPGWLARLTDAVQGDTVAAVPMLVHPTRSALWATPHDLLVRSIGLDIVGDDDLVVAAAGAGTRPDPSLPIREVAAGSSAGVLVRRDAYVEAGGLAHIDDLDAALVDLCGRLRAGGSKVVAVPASVLVDHRSVPTVTALTQPIDQSSQGWRRVLARQEGTLTQLASHRPVTGHLLVRMTIAAPSARVAHRWGDWHLADGLARSLRRRGHSVHLHTLGDTDGRAADIDLVVRGSAAVPRRDGARRVLWVISHPETLHDDECDDADLVVVASEGFARELRGRTSTPVEVLMQGTDPTRFTRREPDDRHAHAIAVVAMTRHVYRPAVRYAVEAGLRPAIYGSDWTEFVDPSLVVAPYVHNHQLPVVYSSIGLLLNDHWDAMRAWGFVSNRIYDALACATPIVSDHLPEIAEDFGDAVATYTDADSLRAAVDLALDDPVAARRRAEAGRELVLAHHTFDRRAEQLVALMARHGLVEGER